MKVSRRRFLSLVSAAALAQPVAARAYRWQGIALGASAQIVLDHPKAEEIAARARAEIYRLEKVFSLFRPDSDLCRLNAEGVLLAPPFELLECLATARHVHAATRGLFDPTVQPLWEVLAQAWASGRSPAEDQLDRARALIGFGRVRFDRGAVILAPGQRLTLNGIAQGYIADRIARLMRQAGVDDVLIDTGEISALGMSPTRQPWDVAIAGTALGCRLTNRALATSAHAGTVLDAAGRVGHILHPLSGTARRPAIDQISISAPSAALADALSTGLCLARNRAEVVAVLKNVKLARIEDIRMQSQT